MGEDKIKWCLKQNKGIELIEIKPHLEESYMKESDEDFEEISSAGPKWKLIKAYYACYNALYSLLMKSGIKCEIHDCTIELMDLFEFSEEDIEYIKELKNNRIQRQYYLKEVFLGDESKVKAFIDKCKEISSELNDDKINEIRDKLKDMKDLK